MKRRTCLQTAGLALAMAAMPWVALAAGPYREIYDLELRDQEEALKRFNDATTTSGDREGAGEPGS